MSFLLFPKPLETSLKISQYDPEKLKKPKASKRRPATTKHPPSNIDTQTGAHRTPQECDLGALIENPLRLLLSGTPSDALGPEACEVSSYYSVRGMTTEQLTRQGIQHGPTIAEYGGLSPALY